MNRKSRNLDLDEALWDFNRDVDDGGRRVPPNIAKAEGKRQSLASLSSKQRDKISQLSGTAATSNQQGRAERESFYQLKESRKFSALPVRFMALVGSKASFNTAPLSPVPAPETSSKKGNDDDQQKLAEPNKSTVIDDLTFLTEPTPSALTQVLSERFRMDEIFTAIQSSAMIAFNPQKSTSLFGNEFMEVYNHADLDSPDFNLPPHPFEMAERVYRQIYTNPQPQTILLRGQSGSGKSEIAKAFLNYFTTKSAIMVDYYREKNEPNIRKEASLEMHMAAILPIIDAFGSTAFLSEISMVQSTRSCLGYVLKLRFDQNGLLAGAKVDTCLLGLQKLLNQEGPTSLQSNFLVFYHLLAGLDQKELQKLKLSKDSSSYRILRSSSGDRNTEQDKTNWFRLRRALLDCNLTLDTIEEITRVLAGLLHLGNIQFSAASVDSASLTHVDAASHVLALAPEFLRSSLNRSGGDTLCQSFMYYLYHGLVQFVMDCVNEVNHAGEECSMVPPISIIDFPGFRNQKDCGLDGFMVNAIDDALQAVLSASLFQEQDQYENDGIVWDSLPMENPESKLKLLLGTTFMKREEEDEDDQEREPKSHQHENLLNAIIQQNLDLKMTKLIEKDTVFSKVIDQQTFQIKHRPGNITYNVKKLKKEQILSVVTADILALWQQCKFKTLKMESKENQSITMNHRKKIRSILEDCEINTCWYVLCFNPNDQELPGVVDLALVEKQINDQSVRELVHLRKKGYPIQMSFLEVYSNYDIIQYTSKTASRRHRKGKQARQTMTDLQPKCVDILQYALSQLPVKGDKLEQYQMGITKMYISYAVYSSLEHLLDIKQHYWATEIQRVWRGYFYGRQIAQYLRSVAAAESTISRNNSQASLKAIQHQQPSDDETFQEQDESSIDENLNDVLPDSDSVKSLNDIDKTSQLSEDIGQAYRTTDTHTIMSMYEQALELMMWISTVLEVTLPMPSAEDTLRQDPGLLMVNHLADQLKDGRILLQVVARVFPEASHVLEFLAENHSSDDYVRLFLGTLLQYSENMELFDVKDLTEKRDVPKVMTVIGEFRQFATFYYVKQAEIQRMEKVSTDDDKTLMERVPAGHDISEMEKVSTDDDKSLMKRVSTDDKTLMKNTKEEHKEAAPSTVEVFDSAKIKKSEKDLSKNLPKSPVEQEPQEVSLMSYTHSDCAQNQKKASYIAQKYEMRKTFAPVDITDLKALKSQRESSVKDLIKTEKLFLDSLKVVIAFRAYLISRGVEKKHVDSLFANIKAVYLLHRDQILGSLEIDDLNGIQVGSLFQELLTKHSMIDTYHKYCKGVTVAYKIIDDPVDIEYMATYLNAFINSARMGNGLGLDVFLKRPFERIMEYLDLLKEVDSVTANSDPDKRNIVDTILVLNELIKSEHFRHNSTREIAERKAINLEHREETPKPSPSPKKADKKEAPHGFERQKVTELSQLHSTARKFICKGSVWEVINTSLVKERTLFLFNDIMIIAKELRSEKKEYSKFEIKTVLDLREIYLKKARDEDPFLHILHTPVLTKAIHRFGMNPKQGVTYLIDKGVISATPASVAQFLYRTPGLNKRQVGKFLGASDNREILEAFLAQFNFTGLRLDEALRLFLGAFRLPGNPTTIDTILDVFANCYFKANGDTLSSEKLTLKLVFALLMLNAEIHRKNESAPLTLEEFISKLQRHDANKELSASVLTDMYQSIQEEKLGVAAANDDQDEELLHIDIGRIPFRISMRETSAPVAVTISAKDNGIIMKLCASAGIECEPSMLEFANSNVATFKVKGTALGRSTISFLKSGPSSKNYAGYSLPQGTPVIVEPPFMKHVFQIKSKTRDLDSKKRISYLFSVANLQQQQNWSHQLDKVLSAAEADESLDYGVFLTDPLGEQILSNFTLSPEGAPIVPTNTVIP